VRSAWKAFQSGLMPEERLEAKLVILHDELEKNFGKVRLKTMGSSGGQKGVEDCINALGTNKFIRLGVGISRPESRHPKVVADYVLGKLSPWEMETLEDQSVPKVAELLKKLAKERCIPGSCTM